MNKKISSLAGIAILVVVAAVVAVVLAYQNWTPKPVAENLTPISSQSGTPAATVTPKSTVNQYAGWETYKNEELGIEFKYPIPFVVSIGRQDKNRNDIFIGTQATPRYAIIIEDQEISDENLKNFLEYQLKNSPGVTSIFEWKNISMGSLRGVEAIYQANVGAGGIFRLAAVAKEGKLYTIYSYQEGNESDFNKLVSSFRFTK